jgi:hypothetical protein
MPIKNQDSHTPVKPAEGSEPTRSQNIQPNRLPWILFGIGIFILLASSGSFLGYQSGINERLREETYQKTITATSQFEMGVLDLHEKRFDTAVSRFEYVLQIDPSFPNVAEMMAEAMLGQIRIQETSQAPQPTNTPIATPTIKPTPDNRAAEEIYNGVVQQIRSKDWNGTIDSIEALRSADRNFKAVDVDGFYYSALRHRGVDKILKNGNPEGGIYDLTLAERFAPIDFEADSYRESARLYLTAVRFWGLNWEMVATYLGNIYAALPNMRDASGYTVAERYRIALVKYAEILIEKGDYCGGRSQYRIALSLPLAPDAKIGPRATEVHLVCSPPTAVPTATRAPAATLAPAPPAPPAVPITTPTVKK